MVIKTVDDLDWEDNDEGNIISGGLDADAGKGIYSISYCLH